MNTTIKGLVRGIYAIQKMRVACGNRVFAYFRGKLGLGSSEKEENLEKETKEMLDLLRLAYRRITDGVVDGTLVKKNKFKPNGLIETHTDLAMVNQYMQLLNLEETQFKNLSAVLEEQPIYTKFLKTVRGVGPAMAGVIISEIDIHKAEYPSSLHMYAGLDVVHIEDDEGNVIKSEGRSRRKEHLVDREYIAADGNPATCKSITYNPFLKTKLMGVLSGSFLRAGAKDNPYRTIYDNYKNRLQNRPDLKDESKGHIDMMAKRYMVKMFLIDLYNVWRRIEGLPVAPTYAEAKLGIQHGSASKYAA